jgi:hypothetical protein
VRTTSRALAVLAAFPIMLASDPIVTGSIGVAFGVLGSQALRAWWPAASPSSEIVNDETPSGATDGANRIFVLAHEPRPRSLVLFVDRARQLRLRDFSVDGRIITFTAESIPPKGAFLVAQYLR